MQETNEHNVFINIRGHHVEVTPAIESYINEKLQRILRHNHSITTIDIILKVAKDNHKAEGVIKFKGRKNIFVDVITGDMYESIDKLIDRLDRKALEHKERNRKHGRKLHVKNVLRGVYRAFGKIIRKL